MKTLKFSGYEGTVALDGERGVWRGKLLLTGDLVTYEARTALDLQKEFEAAVLDYIETCRGLGRPPKPAANPMTQTPT